MEAGLTEMAISRANSALAGEEALQLISTYIGRMATAGDDGTPSREIDSEPFAGIVEVSNTVDGETTTSCATTFTGLALALVTTTLPNTVQKGLVVARIELNPNYFFDRICRKSLACSHQGERYKRR